MGVADIEGGNANNSSPFASKKTLLVAGERLSGGETLNTDLNLTMKTNQSFGGDTAATGSTTSESIESNSTQQLPCPEITMSPSLLAVPNQHISSRSENMKVVLKGATTDIGDQSPVSDRSPESGTSVLSELDATVVSPVFLSLTRVS